MIRSFADAETEKIFVSPRSRNLPPDIQQTARRKLRQVNCTTNLYDLRALARNRVEQLKGFTPPRP